MSFRKSLLIAAAAIALAGPVMAQDYIEVTTPPPTAPYEVVPASRAGYVWAPGYWSWEGGQYVWVQGEWLAARPDYTWVEARWHNDNGHWYYDKGHWAHTVYDPEEHRDWQKEYHELPRRVTAH